MAVKEIRFSRKVSFGQYNNIEDEYDDEVTPF